MSLRLIFLVIVFASCKSYMPIKEITYPIQIAEKILGENPHQSANESNSHLLFIQANSDPANNRSRFLVIERTTGKVEFEKSFRPGFVKWRNNSTIEYLDIPGNLQDKDLLEKFVKTWIVPAKN